MSIKVGDAVKLIDKFYEHEKFKGDKRHIRKQIASLKGKEFEVYAIVFGRAHTTADIMYTIPLDLLEKVEPDRPVFEAGKSYVFDKTLLEQKPRPDGWENDVDGKNVGFEPGSSCGIVRGYMVMREWCKEAKHRYTAKQRAEAEKIIGKIIADMAWRHQIAFALVDGNIIALSWRDRYSDTKQVFEAKCSPHDEYNETIGKMVCLCRAAHRKLPDWV